MKNKLIILLLFSVSLYSQETLILAGKVWNGDNEFKENMFLHVEGEEIVSIEKAKKNIKHFIDLSDMWVLPGLMLPLVSLELDSSYAALDFVDLNRIDPENFSNHYLSGISSAMYHYYSDSLQSSTVVEYDTYSSKFKVLALDFFSQPDSVYLKCQSDALNYATYNIEPDTISLSVLFRNIHRKELYLNYLNKDIAGIFHYIPGDTILNNPGEHISFLFGKTDTVQSDTLKSENKFIYFDNISDYVDHFSESPGDTLKEQRIPIIRDYSEWEKRIKEYPDLNIIDVMTQNVAAFYHLDDSRGKISERQQASLLFFNKNPLEIDAKITLIMHNGKFVKNHASE